MAKAHEEHAEAEAKAHLWKWIAMLVISSAASGLLGTFMALVRVPDPLSEKQLRTVVKSAMAESFTDISTSKGMYAIEGRPRLEALEAGFKRMDAKLDKLLEAKR